MERTSTFFAIGLTAAALVLQGCAAIGPGFDSTKVALPGCDAKVAGSIEIPWNYFEVDEERMSGLASAFVKLEESLDELRASSGDG